MRGDMMPEEVIADGGTVILVSSDGDDDSERKVDAQDADKKSAKVSNSN